MKKPLLFGLILGASALVAPASEASDHVDGIKTALDPSADLTDLYTFVSPTNPNKVVMVMNIHMLASSKTRFSNTVDYVFRIRPIDDARKLAPTAKEQTISCGFTSDGPSGLIDANQHATCTAKIGNDEPIVVKFDTRSSNYKAGGAAEKDGVKVFAGVRSDSWFLDLKKAVKLVNEHNVTPDKGKNGLNGMNVLSIVVEVDKEKLAGPMLAITAQTVIR